MRKELCNYLFMTASSCESYVCISWESLTYLEHLLSTLPDTVLSTGNIYDFQGFPPDPTFVDGLGATRRIWRDLLLITLSRTRS